LKAGEKNVDGIVHSVDNASSLVCFILRLFHRLVGCLLWLQTLMLWLRRLLSPPRCSI
jgi:hypothetical protein